MTNKKEIQNILFSKGKDGKPLKLTACGVIFFTLLGFRYLVYFIGRKKDNENTIESK